MNVELGKPELASPDLDACDNVDATIPDVAPVDIGVEHETRRLLALEEIGCLDLDDHGPFTITVRIRRTDVNWAHWPECPSVQKILETTQISQNVLIFVPIPKRRARI